MVKKVQKRGRPCKKKSVVKRPLRASRAVSGAGQGSGSGSGTGTGTGPKAPTYLLPCPSLRRVPNEGLPRMCAVRDCKDEELGIRALGGEDLDVLQLELESLLSSVAVRLCQLNEQLTVLNGLETGSPGRGRKQRKTVIPAPAPPIPQPPSDDKASVSPCRPPVKAPVKKLGKMPPPGPSPGFSHPPRKRSKIIRRRPDEDETTKPQGKQLERDFIPHKYWSTLDPYCDEVTEDSYNLLSDILCRNETEVPSLYDIPPLGEHFSREWDIKDFVENQDFGSSSPALSSPSTPSTPPTNITPTSVTESFGNAIRRKFRECSIALKRTLRTSADKAPAPASPPPTPATSKLMAALLGEIPQPVTPLQESKEHNVIVKVEKEDDEKVSLKASRPNSVSGSSTNSEILRKHQRRCLERKLLLDKDAQGDVELSVRGSEVPESVLEELKRTQAELKVVVDHNTRNVANLTNIIIEEIKIRSLKRKLQEVDDAVTNIYHTRTAAKLAKQTISQDDIDQAWKALKERDKIIRKLDFFERSWTPKAAANVSNPE